MRACDYNVYRIKFTSEEQIRVQASPGDDFEGTGRYHIVEREYLIVAPDSTLAETLWRHRYRHTQVGLISISHLGQVNDMIFLQ